MEIHSKGEFEDWLYEQTGGVVQSGPFKGMNLFREQSWDSGFLSPQLLGCYEAELHEVIEQEIERLESVATPKIVNVGCAEGYYAVGLKRRLPHARMYVIDTDEKALRIARHTAALNGVSLISGEPLSEVFAAPDLVVMDCEGAEVEYLDAEKFPDLKHAHIIVELHNLLHQDTQGILTQRWHGSHDIECIWEGPRNPNIYEILHRQSSLVRWFAVNEGRPCLMAWYVMKPRLK
jgi:hypothetical protein